MDDIAPLCLVITSSIDFEGKSTVASNLALAFSEVGKRVVLVDAELRHPTIARVAGIADEPGLSTILTGTRRPLGSVRKAGLGIVDVITSGALPSNPTALLSRPSVATLITQLRHDYDVIIIDTPPAGSTTDAAILAAHADGVILVAARRRVHAPQFTGALEALERAGASVIGIVLNETRRRWFSGSAAAEDYRPNTTIAEPAPSETVTTSDDESLEPTLNK
jgi:capsular exopolysaccharide synthesis family protein